MSKKYNDEKERKAVEKCEGLHKELFGEDFDRKSKAREEEFLKLDERLNKELEQFELERNGQVDESFFNGAFSALRLLFCIDRLLEKGVFTKEEAQVVKNDLYSIVFSAGERE